MTEGRDGKGMLEDFAEASAYEGRAVVYKGENFFVLKIDLERATVHLRKGDGKIEYAYLSDFAEAMRKNKQ